MMGFWRMAAGVALAAFGFGAEGVAAEPAPGRLVLRPCQVEGVREPLRCGTFQVFEDPVRRSGRQLPLKVVVIPARSATPKEPVFILSGGPGQAATQSVPGFVDGWEREDHDVVFMDLRGTGEGHSLDCPPPAAEGLQAYVEPLFSEQTYAECRKRLEAKADLTLYTTPIAMQDLDEARRALGYDKIVLEGGSYGTRAALVYLRSYGDHVRAAFLSGNAPFENRAPLYHAAAAQRAFDRIVAQCRADAACRAAYPTLEGDLAAVLARVRSDPPRARVKHPQTGVESEIRLTPAAFGDGLRVMLYQAETGRRVPLLLQKAKAGDFQAFADAAVQNGYGLRQAIVMGLLLSVSCPEDVARVRPEEIARETGDSFTGDYRMRGQMAACAVWPKGKLPADYAAPFRSPVPALIVSGDLDPVTPPRWGEVMLRYLPNGVHVVAPGAHVADSPCIAQAARRLFATGTARGLDLSCVDRETLPPFVLP
jgi:pimeloyl-ACP methyl ester carboxylesterase